MAQPQIPVATFRPQSNSQVVEYAPQLAVVPGASVSTTTLATATSVCSLSHDFRVVSLMSSCPNPVVVTIGPTLATGVNWLQLESGNTVVIDGDTNGLRFMAGTVIGCYSATASLSGTLRVSLV